MKKLLTLLMLLTFTVGSVATFADDADSDACVSCEAGDPGCNKTPGGTPEPEPEVETEDVEDDA